MKMNTISTGILDMNKINIKEILINLFIHKKNKYFISDSINEKNYTYGEFFNLSLSISDFLREKGVNQEDTISYICENSIYSLALYIANLLLGSTIAPIDSLKGEKEIQELISITNPKIVLTLKDLETIAYENIDYSENIFENADFNSPFLITFTSGSTGEAKGVVHSFSNLFLSAVSFGNKFKFSSKNTFYHNFPMAYMAGILNLFIKPLIFGAQIVVSERLSVATAMNFWQKVIKYNVNSFWFNPTFVSLLMKLDRGTEGSEYSKKTDIIACIGTAPLDTNLKNKFEEKYGFTLYESYGLSETLFLTTNYPKKSKAGAVGEILESVEIKFSNDDEICIKAPWMFLRYLNYETKLESNFFPTGDLGYIEDGFLTISGRKKDIIIKGGVNISPKRIENFISSHFDEVVILGLKDSILGEKIACFYVSNDFNNEKRKNLNSLIIKELGKDYSIDNFYNLDEIPKNINGKVDKIKLKEEYEK